MSRPEDTIRLQESQLGFSNQRYHQLNPLRPFRLLPFRGPLTSTVEFFGDSDEGLKDGGVDEVQIQTPVMNFSGLARSLRTNCSGFAAVRCSSRGVLIPETFCVPFYHLDYLLASLAWSPLFQVILASGSESLNLTLVNISSTILLGQ